MSFLHFLISSFLCGSFLRLFPQWTTRPHIIVSQSVSGELNPRPLRWMSLLWPAREKIIQPRDEGTDLGKTRRCIILSLFFSAPDMIPRTGRVGRCSESIPLIELTQVHSVLNLMCDLGHITLPLRVTVTIFREWMTTLPILEEGMRQ